MQVTLIAAQSLDGMITRHDEPGSSFTSAADKEHFCNAMREFDCRVMGAETYRVWRERTRKAASAARPYTIMTRDPARFAAEAVRGNLEFSDAAPAAVLHDFATRGYSRCALLGGAKINALFLKAGLVNSLWITVEPLLFGRGTPLLGSEVDLKLKLISSQLLSPDTLLLKYQVPPS
jgi:dihydrofolate reductase